MPARDDDDLLTADDLARMLKVSKKTVLRMVDSGEFPRPLPVAGGKRWSMDDYRRYKMRLEILRELGGQEGTNADTAGQSGTSAPEGQNPPSGRKSRG